MADTGHGIKFFRTRKIGPEAKIEDSIVYRLKKIFNINTKRSWLAGSIPIGAGIPDIVIIEFKPEVYALCNVELPKAQLLAYLRAIPRARVETIADRLQQPREILIRCLDDLVEFEIVEETAGVYKLSECWKDILPDITTIEVKISDWKKAITQAARNRVFAHRSYIATPLGIAIRIKDHKLFKMLGIGILGVGTSGAITVVRHGRKSQPKVWDYYYKLAELTALHLTGETNGIYGQY